MTSTNKSVSRKKNGREATKNCRARAIGSTEETCRTQQIVNMVNRASKMNEGMLKYISKNTASRQLHI